MRARASLAALAIGLLAMVVIGGAGAASAAQRTVPAAHKGASLRTVAAAKHYLRSIGIDPAGFVVQRGTRNYAGPKCPGKTWSCTRAKHVIQMGGRSSRSSRTLAAATLNTFVCEPTTAQQPGTSSATQTCILVQMGPGANSARCVEKSSAPAFTQTCTVSQTGTTNDATVQQVINTGTSSTIGSVQTQDSTQLATVTQMGDVNSVSISQTINQSLDKSVKTGSISQVQNTHQSSVVCQGGTTDCTTPNTGKNTSKIDQSVFGMERASGGVIDQHQDENFDTSDACSPFGSPDICARVAQSSSSNNDSGLHQQSHLLQQASGTAGSNVDQKQYHFSGGIEGHVDQPTDPGPTNSNIAHEHLTGDQTAPAGANQNQDPKLSCCSTQGGNTNSKNDVHQVGRLRASEADAFQNLELDGSAESGGNCSVFQAGRVNGDSSTAHDQQTAGEFPAFCAAFTDCTNGSVDLTLAPTQTGECFSETGPGDDLSAPATASTTSTSTATALPTLTQLLAMGFDWSDLYEAIAFVFPLRLPTTV
jgi:hypothetical protein